MSNLKKVLSLVLALALALTMFAGALNTELPFSDESKLTDDQQDALSLLYALGIVQGMGDGTVGTGNLTRAELTKILYLLYNGQDDSAKYAGETFFDDVAADAWYAQYINWAYAAKVVNGYGNGKFGPTDNVTGVQAVAMVVRLIGKDAAGTDAIGDNWESESKAAAIKLGLTEGIVSSNFYATAIARGDMFILVANTLMNSDIAEDVYGLTIISDAVLSSSNSTYGYSVYTFKYYDAATKAYADYKFKFVVDAKATAGDFGKKFTLIADMRDSDKDGVYDLYAAYEMDDSSTYKTYTGKVTDMVLEDDDDGDDDDESTYEFDSACKYYVNNIVKTYAVFAVAFGQKNSATYTFIDTDGDGDIDYAYVQALALADITTSTIEGKITAQDKYGYISIDGKAYKYGNFYNVDKKGNYTDIDDTSKADVKAVAGANGSVLVSDVTYSFVVDDTYIYTIAICDKTQYSGNYALINSIHEEETLRGLPYLLWLNEDNVVVDGYLKNLNNGRNDIDDLDESDLVYIVSYDGTYVEMLTADYANSNYTQNVYNTPDLSDLPILYHTDFVLTTIPDQNLSTLNKSIYIYVSEEDGSYKFYDYGYASGKDSFKATAWVPADQFDSTGATAYYTRQAAVQSDEDLTYDEFVAYMAGDGRYASTSELYYKVHDNDAWTLCFDWDAADYEPTYQYAWATSYTYVYVATPNVAEYNAEAYYEASAFAPYASGEQLGVVYNFSTTIDDEIDAPGYWCVYGLNYYGTYPKVNSFTYNPSLEYYTWEATDSYTIYFDFPTSDDDNSITQIYKVNGVWRMRNYYDIQDMLDDGSVYILVNGKKQYLSLTDDNGNVNGFNIASGKTFYYAIDGNDPGTTAGDRKDEIIPLYYGTSAEDIIYDTPYVTFIEWVNKVNPSTVIKLNADKGVIFAYGQISYGAGTCEWKAYDAEDFYFTNWGSKEYAPFDNYGESDEYADELIYTTDTAGTVYVKAMKVTIDSEDDVLPISWINADAKLYLVDSRTGAWDATKGYEVKVLGFNGAVSYVWIDDSNDIGDLFSDKDDETGVLILATVDANGVVTDYTIIADDFFSAISFIDQNYTGDSADKYNWNDFDGTTFYATDIWGNDGYKQVVDPTKTIFLKYDISAKTCTSVSATDVVDVLEDDDIGLASGTYFEVFIGYSYNIVCFQVD